MLKFLTKEGRPEPSRAVAEINIRLVVLCFESASKSPRGLVKNTTGLHPKFLIQLTLLF